jgi:hypothetical protein
MKYLPSICLFLIITLFAALAFSGCSDAAFARWQRTRDTLRAELSATTQQISQLQTQIDALPPGALRDQAQAALFKAQVLAPQLETRLTSLDQVLSAAHGGDPSSLGAGVSGLLTGLPYVGPYAGIIGLLAGLGWGIYQRVRRDNDVISAQAAAEEIRRHLANVVRSLEQAGPEWSAEDKANIAAIQGPATTAAVRRIKEAA